MEKVVSEFHGYILEQETRRLRTIMHRNIDDLKGIGALMKQFYSSFQYKVV